MSRIQEAEPRLRDLKPVLIIKDWPRATAESLGEFAKIETEEGFRDQFHAAGLAPMLIAGDLDSVIRILQQVCKKDGSLVPKAWAIQCLDPANADEKMQLMVTLLH